MSLFSVPPSISIWFGNMYVKICPFIALKNMFHTYSKAFKHMWVSTGFVLNALKWPVFCLHHQRWNLHSSLRTGWCQQLWQVKCVFQASVNIFQWTKFESMFHRLRLFSLHSATIYNKRDYPQVNFIIWEWVHYTECQRIQRGMCIALFPWLDCPSELVTVTKMVFMQRGRLLTTQSQIKDHNTGQTIRQTN